MVTRTQIDKLASRIDALEVAIGGQEIEWKVYLTFFEPSGNLPVRRGTSSMSATPMHHVRSCPTSC